MQPEPIRVASSSSEIAGTTNALYLALQEGHVEVACLLLKEFGSLDLIFKHTDPSVSLGQLTVTWCTPRFIPRVRPAKDCTADDGERPEEVYCPMMAVNPQSLDALLRSDSFNAFLAADFAGFSSAVSVQVVSAAIARVVRLYKTDGAERVHLDNAIRRIPRLLAILGDHLYISQNVLLGVYNLASFQPSPKTDGTQSALPAIPDTVFIHRSERCKILEALAMFGVRPADQLFKRLLSRAVEDFLKSAEAQHCSECCSLIQTIAAVSVTTQAVLNDLQQAISRIQDKVSQNPTDASPEQQKRKQETDQKARGLIEFLQSLCQTISSSTGSHCMRVDIKSRQTHTPTTMLSGSILRARLGKPVPTQGIRLFPRADPCAIVREKIVVPLERLFPWFGRDQIMRYLADPCTCHYLSIPPVEVIRVLAEGEDDRPLHIPDKSS